MSDLASLVGVPYVDRGRDIDRDGGLDCYGLVRLGLERLGVQWPVDEAEALAAPEGLARRLVDGERPGRGDVVEMSIEGQAHVGLVVDNGFTVLKHGDRRTPSVLVPLAVLRRLRVVVGISRPRGTEPSHDVEHQAG
jgi:cell wall-associated NlpC family hydrolase